MTNWRKAVLLLCPRCLAQNRPGATIIERENTEAVCGVCRHRFVIRQTEERPDE